MTAQLTPKFELGQIVETQGASNIDRLTKRDALIKHRAGDWGLTCEEDRRVNDEALEHGYRIMSVWKDRNGLDYWIITESDRSLTTILLPSEY